MLDFPLKSAVIYSAAEFHPELMLYLADYGREIRRSCDYFWDNAKRNEETLIWQYTLSGFGELRLDGKSRKVLPGEAMLLKTPSESCYCLPAASRYWDFVFVTLRGREALRLADEFHRLSGPVTSFPGSGRALQIVHEFFTMPPERLLDPFFNSAAAYRFLMEIFSEIKRGGEKEDDKLLKKIRNHILVHMEHTPSLEELALLADCSPWHFARKFQKISGMAPRQFVLSLKMQYAAQLLHNTLDPIKEVARKCGYDDPSYFCRVFRKYHNTSPAEFRKNGSGEW